MNILFFDTETTGLPKSWNAPITDFENWPRMVQLAFSLYEDGELAVILSYIIKPDGYEIPVEASQIHGITTEIAINEGVPLQEALVEFKDWLEQADIIIGHNISFDRKIVGCEMLRSGMPDLLHGKPRLCTMRKSTTYCNLPGKRGPKFPKLEELTKILFDEAPEGLHDAAEDIRLTAKCYFKLRELGVITDEDTDQAINYKTVEGF